MAPKTDLSDVLDLLGEAISADEDFARYAEKNPISAFDEILVRQKQNNHLQQSTSDTMALEIDCEPLTLEELRKVCGG